MNGQHVLLILAHLFRKRGNPVPVEDAVDFLSFCCRYGRPSDIRRMLTLAVENEMITAENGIVSSEFLYDEQELPYNLTASLGGRVSIREDVTPLD